MAALTGAAVVCPDPVDRGPRVPVAVRPVVLARAGFRCERCGVDVAAGGCDVHHRRPAGAGGSTAAGTHRPGNLVLLCVGCHRSVESGRALARAQGWLVVQGQDPADVPVVVYRLGEVWLHPTEPRYVRITERLAGMDA